MSFVLPSARLSKNTLIRHPILRAMSSANSPTVFVVPIDPSSVSDSSVVEGLSPSKLWRTLPASKASNPAKAGTTHVLFNTPPEQITALSSVGPAFSKKQTPMDSRRESIRTAIGSAVQQVKALGEGIHGQTVGVDLSAVPDSDAHWQAASEAAYLASYDFDLKTTPLSPHFQAEATPSDKLSFTPVARSLSEQMKQAWDEGKIYADAQNLARTLMELPANMLTPTLFVERIAREAEGLTNVAVIPRDRDWAAEKGMRSFLSVSKGSAEPPRFLELHYRGAPKEDHATPPLVFVGKGITFDSGGISIKPSADMKLMRGDMGGAATVCATVLAIARLGLPINVTAVTPLSENLPGPAANKPGDVVRAMNGTSIEIDNTDAEGRLVLADALYYAVTEFKPKVVVDVATLTGAMDIALGEVYTGVFTNSTSLWDTLARAGSHTHDRFWRLPLSSDYAPQIAGGRSNADLCNTGGKPAGACTAALFLRSFVPGACEDEIEGVEPAVRWAHVDMAGTMEATRKGAYQECGMTGRPTRALIEFAKSFV